MQVLINSQIKDVFYRELIEEPTIEKFREFVKNNCGEFDNIDFKEKWIEKGKLSKLLLALANSQGGIIVFGLKEENDHSIIPTGLTELKDKADINSNVAKYLPPELDYQVFDFSFESSEYEKLNNKKFQMVVVSNTPERLPFISLAESKYLKKDIINIQRIKKEEAKKNLINKIKSSKKNKENKSQNKKRVSIAVENIPKTKLKTSDDSFKLLLNTIMGIQIAVESSPDIVEVQNINQYLHSMTYSIQTSNISKNKNESFMIKEYAGIVFNKIRRLYNYDKESFIQSISPQVFITEIINLI